MKLKRLLAITMSVILIMYSFPVYATSEENMKETEAESSTTGSAMEEETAVFEKIEQTEEIILEKRSDDEGNERESIEESRVIETDESIGEEENTAKEYIQERKGGYKLETEVFVDSGLMKEESAENESETEEITGIAEQQIENTDASDIASGIYENITWVIDKDGKLTVTGTGEFSDKISNDRAPWYENRTSITSAEVSLRDIENLNYMFCNCDKLTNISFSEFDTSNAIDMSGMFYGCSSLTSLDLGSFDTKNVEHMTAMFAYCGNLTNLNVSSFDTGNVTNMNLMFGWCCSLTSLDVSNFNTKNVTIMSNMFNYCCSLTSLDLSSFDTKNVTSMGSMFSTCNKLTNLNLSNFDTTNLSANGVDAMFNGCSSLTSLDLSSFDLSNINDAQYMLNGCTNLTKIQTPKNITIEIQLPASEEGYRWYYGKKEIISLPQNLSNSVEIKKQNSIFSEDDIASGTYESITWIIDKDGKLTVIGNGELFPDHYGYHEAPWYEHREDILSAEILVEGITDLSYIFYECKNLASVNLSGLDTSNVTNMESMFNGCSSLTGIDLSSFDTRNVTDMGGMFGGCSSLLNLDVSGFDTKQVTIMAGMFSRCSSLSKIDVRNFDTSKVTDMNMMFSECNNLTSLDVGNFDTSKVISMLYMFFDCNSLTSLDLSSFNTNETLDMYGMFGRCGNLESIDIINFNTRNVTNMRCMFSECSSLENLDVSSFDTGKVTDMSYMFSGSGLTSIDVSNFNTSKVTDMTNMFGYCDNLENLDLHSFDMTNINAAADDMYSSYMFSNCSNLQTIKTPKNVKIDIALPEGDGDWYYNEEKISIVPVGLSESVEIKRVKEATSPDNIANGTYENITWVIDKNGKLTVTGTGEYATLSPATEDDYWTRAPWYGKRESILSAEINVTGIRDTSCMFRNCTNLKSIDVKNLDTSQVANMEQMFRGCTNLEDIDTSGFHTGNVILMDGMFEGCTNLKTLDVSGFDTKNVTWMANMFKGCSNLNSLDVSGFDTGKVWKFYGMFEGCSNLENIDVSSFSTQSAQYIYRMFYECSSLKSITFGPQFDTKAVTEMARMFYGCSSLENIDISGFNTDNVTYMQHMFRGCNKLKTIKFGSHFDTSKVTDMRSMFRECSSLESLDLSVFRTDSVTSMEHMFDSCGLLRTVDLSNFNTENVTDISGMFRECGSLNSLDLSSFNLGNVSETSGVFTSCTNLNTIQTPKNVVTNIGLPVSEGYSWYYNESEIIELPQNLSVSVKVTKDVTKNPDTPVTPEIITDKIDNAVQNVPYESILQNNGWDAANYRISSGALPEGIDLGTDGVIYGITKEAGKFQFTVTMTVNGISDTAGKTYTLEVLKSTDKVVDAVEDPGYEIIQPIQDFNITKEITDQLFISKGPYEEFRNAYIDGDKLVRNVDYTAESGSTRITIKAETLGRLEKGKHTLGVEFRTEEGSLKRVAQNFDAKSGTAKKGGSSGSGDSESGDSFGNGNQTKVTVTGSNIMETAMDDTMYYSVFLPSDDAILRLSFFNKVYGDNAVILAYLDNGIGYNLNMNAFLSAGKDLDLSTRETELAGFAQGFRTIWLSIAQKADLSYDLGINLTAGADYANHPVYIFIFDDASNTFLPYMETIVAASGNVGFHTRRLTDFVVMIAE